MTLSNIKKLEVPCVWDEAATAWSGVSSAFFKAVGAGMVIALEYNLSDVVFQYPQDALMRQS